MNDKIDTSGGTTSTRAPSTRFVGLDVHKHSVTACIVDGQGRVLRELEFALTRESLAVFAERTLARTDAVALEATTNCWAVAEVLRPHVARVVVSNPMATKAIAKSKVKTDKVDARVLAHLLRLGYLPEVWHPDAATQRLRQLTGRRARLVQQRTALRNRIHSVLAMRLTATPESLFGPGGLAWLKSLLSSGQLDEAAVLMIDSDLRLLQALQAELDRFEDVLVRGAWQQDQVRLLTTLPGVDVTVALAVLAALGDVSRSTSPKQAAAYLGLVPRTRQSATKCYHGPITKAGNTQARWMLIQAAQHLGKNPGPLGHFFRRLKRRKNHNVAVVAAARKLVMIAVHMLKQNEPYRYAQPRTTETKLSRLRVRATGNKRRSGPAKGEKGTAKLPGGSRTIKSLDRVYAEESLPPRHTNLAPGELRLLRQTDCDTFVASLAHDQLIPKKGQPTNAKP